MALWPQRMLYQRLVSAAMPSARTRILLAALVYAAIFLGLLAHSSAHAQTAPYGIETRVANTSLLVDLSQGPPPATLAASGLFNDTAAQTIA